VISSQPCRDYSGKNRRSCGSVGAVVFDKVGGRVSSWASLTIIFYLGFRLRAESYIHPPVSLVMLTYGPGDSNDDADVALRRRLISENSPIIKQHDAALHSTFVLSPHPQSQRRFDAVTLINYNITRIGHGTTIRAVGAHDQTIEADE
jgi:hypothetical protein